MPANTELLTNPYYTNTSRMPFPSSFSLPPSLNRLFNCLELDSILGQISTSTEPLDYLSPSPSVMKPIRPSISKQRPKKNVACQFLHLLAKGLPTVFHLHLVVERGKTAVKALEALMLRHHYYATHTCRSEHDDVYLPAKRRRRGCSTTTHYEFSCSSTPTFTFHPAGSSSTVKQDRSHCNTGRGSVMSLYHLFDGSDHLAPPADHDIQDVDVVDDDALPVVAAGVGGGGLLGLKNDETAGGYYVDWAAEEFIERFYQELRSQNHGMETPVSRWWLNSSELEIRH